MRKRDFFHTGLDVSRSECQLARLNNGIVFGDTYVVDGTRGKDGNDGNIYSPFETIQKALTIQAAENSGRGDRIWIMPGTYAETLTSTALMGVEILGGGLTSGAVTIEPTTGGSFALTTMTESIIKNLTMYTSNDTNETLAAFRVMIMTDSAIDGCRFQAGTTGIVTSTAFRLGHEAGTYVDATSDQFLRSAFTNNIVNSLAGGFCFYYGFVFGASVQTNAGTGGNTRFMTGSMIGNNRINAETYAILLNTNKNSGGSSYIMNNTCMGAHLERGNCGKSAIHAVDPDTGENVLIKVIGNMCNSDDGITGFDSHNLMNNLSAIHLTNAVGQYPAQA